jgi:uncharacterized membrane protein (DUF2068 family)
MAADSRIQAQDRPKQPRNALGLRFIVGYKLVKAIAELLLGAVLLSLASAGSAGHLREVALNVRNHAAEAWSVALAERLVRASTERNLLVVGLAILLDGALSGIEGWALYHRYRWSRWFVVGATFALVPFEGLALASHFSVGRIALLIGNVSIVIYLVWRGVMTERQTSFKGVPATSTSKPS